MFVDGPRTTLLSRFTRRTTAIFVTRPYTRIVTIRDIDHTSRLRRLTRFTQRMATLTTNRRRRIIVSFKPHRTHTQITSRRYTFFRTNRRILFFSFFQTGRRFQMTQLNRMLTRPNRRRTLITRILNRRNFRAVGHIILGLIQVSYQRNINVNMTLFIDRRLTRRINRVHRRFQNTQYTRTSQMNRTIIGHGTTVNRAQQRVGRITQLRGPLVNNFRINGGTRIYIQRRNTLKVTRLTSFPVTLTIALRRRRIMIIRIQARTTAQYDRTSRCIVSTPTQRRARIFRRFTSFQRRLVSHLRRRNPLNFQRFTRFIFDRQTSARFPKALTILSRRAQFGFFFRHRTNRFIQISQTFRVERYLTSRR